MQRRAWHIVPADEERVRRAASALDVPEVIGRLLCQRDLDEPDVARRFLAPALDQLHDPLLLTGMREAVDRLLGAVSRGERIGIHGDYDVDGITATVILRRALEVLGADVVHFVPDRFRDGYGLQPETVERLKAAGAVVIVTVDCGIRATEAATRARDLGLDLIITDHHEPEGAAPAALAVINPKQPGCRYPDKWLSGAGVALKLVQALLTAAGRGSELLPHFVKVAAIGTLADVVPLTGENRVIARCGLDVLSRGPHAAGLDALLAESGLQNRTLDSFHISFLIAPRLNAAGRMGSADLALDLLLLNGRDADVAAQARRLARQLTTENLKRRDVESKIFAQAKRMVERDPDVGGQNLLVVAGQDWHRGVIGIVASKLAHAYGKPTIVLSIQDGLAQGSGRSIPEFDLLEALDACRDVFIRYGGHRQAAGVTLEAERVGELRRRLADWANARLSPDDLVPRLRIDAPLGLGGISSEVVAGLTMLAPFGEGNPKPVFRAAPVDLVADPRKVKERHLALRFRQDGRTFRAIAWRAADREEYLSAHRHGLELAYSLDQGEYRGEKTTEMTVADVRVPEDQAR